ncbi:MAG: hypothetical protein M5U34_07880 [Chloroflexi bacterium]|nr:hypothetical protein [Chloroflexota bacterium]
MSTNYSEEQSSTTGASMKRRLLPLARYRSVAILLVVMLVLLVGPGLAISSTIPTISITNVVTDQTVTIVTYNYPANQNFVVTMGPMGSKGIGGYYVTTINSGAGGSLPATFAIPEQLKGSYQIAIRLESAQGFYSFNWFYNNTTGIGGPPGYTGIPTFSILGVTANQNVTVRMNNFPANQVFRWTMGPMGTQGINGFAVSGFEAWNSGAGGQQDLTLSIPAQLNGSYQISIRAQTGHPWPHPYYAYNWFYNNTTGSGGLPTPPPPTDSYTGIPTFKVCRVVQNSNVTIRTNNFPPNQTFLSRWGQCIRPVSMGSPPRLRL